MSEESQNLINEENVRLEKLNKIKELGIDVYPENYLGKINTKNVLNIGNEKVLRDVEEIKVKFKELIKVAGRIMTYRSHGKIAFAQLQDEKGRIQIAFVKNIVKVNNLNEEKQDSYKFIEKLIDIG